MRFKHLSSLNIRPFVEWLLYNAMFGADSLSYAGLNTRAWCHYGCLTVLIGVLALCRSLEFLFKGGFVGPCLML